jgi:drug/metabolite transporter (DMT)-like permease
MRVREYAVLFGLALIWGASFLFIKIAVESVSPGTLVAGRIVSSLVTLGLIAALRPRLLAGWWRFGWYGLLVGAVNITIPYLLIGWGETGIGSGTTSILNATTPLFTVVLANWWIGAARERLTAKRAGGVVLGFAGVAVLLGPQALDFTGGGSSALIHEGAVLVAAAAYGVGSLMSRRFSGAAPLVGPVTTQVGALLLVLPVAVLWNPPHTLPPLPALGAIVELGVPGLAIAYLLYFWLIRHVGPTRTTLVTYLLPCTALLWGAIFLSETIAWNTLAGLALILLGTMITNGTLDGLVRRPMSKPMAANVATPPAEVEAATQRERH